MQFFSQIFIDGGDPAETREADRLLKKAGHVGVQGQTTNPSLIAKRAIAYFSRHSGLDPESRVGNKLDPGSMAGMTGKAISEKELLAFWRKTVEEMAKVTKGPISIQVVGDATLTTEQMLTQARDRITWIPNAVVKFPATTNGLAAAEIFCQEGPVNITLNFSQEQAAAVYIATKTHNYDVFVSPFVGRLDDVSENGMALIADIVQIYKNYSSLRLSGLDGMLGADEHPTETYSRYVEEGSAGRNNADRQTHKS